METKIIKINPKEIKLLELNARFMKATEFKKLVENVKRDGCLTQLPFCAYNEKNELEVLSGNHRVQAAIQAGLKEIDIQMTEQRLTKDQKIAIQLSHNAISGQDDMAILKELYGAIDDVNMKAYSGLDDETLKLLNDIKTQSMSAEGLKYYIINLLFLPHEIKQIRDCLKEAKQIVGTNVTLMARFEDYDKYLDTMVDMSKGSRIKNTACCFMAMLEIVNNHIEDLKDCWIEDAQDKEYVPISTIIGRSDMKAKDARLVDKAIEDMIAKSLIKKTEKEKGLALLAESYLGKKG